MCQEPSRTLVSTAPWNLTPALGGGYQYPREHGGGGVREGKQPVQRQMQNWELALEPSPLASRHSVLFPPGQSIGWKVCAWGRMWRGCYALTIQTPGREKVKAYLCHGPDSADSAVQTMLVPSPLKKEPRFSF